MKKPFKKYLVRISAFMLLFVMHLVGSFVAWSLAPGNVVPHAEKTAALMQRVAWPIFSFPLFYVVPENVSTTSFESVLVMNSVLVAFGILLATSLILIFRCSRHRPA